MEYDKPAKIVWVAKLSATGLYESPFLKIVDPSSTSNNVVNEYTDLGVENYTINDYFVNTNLLFSITDNNFNSNRSTFDWAFSAYRGFTESSSAMVAVNYFNNYTANVMELVVNYNNQILSPPFYFDPYETSPVPTASKSFFIPAGAQNFPIPLWVRVNDASAISTFTCLVCTNPSVILTNNTARWNSVNIPTPTPTPSVTTTSTVTPTVTPTNTVTPTVTPTIQLHQQLHRPTLLHQQTQ